MPPLHRMQLLGVFGVVLTIMFIQAYSLASSGYPGESVTEEDIQYVNTLLSTVENHDKWIVITTINEPTEAIFKFAALSAWKLVVVGDVGTPVDWNVPGVIFLPATMQQLLGYKISKRIPLKSYARKNVGYLFAIQHGAQVIYESDDDNILLNGRLVVHGEHSTGDVYQGHSNTVNPYAQFGYRNMWPRGYPLDNIRGDSRENATFEVGVKCIPVQQGLANLDPDVDAIWRLTQPHLIGKIRFDKRPRPLIFPSGTMSPYNTQNTVQLYSAFWGLLLPVSTTFRVCDIWRGYWVQRILWELDCSLSFTEPLVDQVRNAHNYMKDFAEELDLYAKAGFLVHFLIHWEAPTNDTIQELISRLAHAMAVAEFWGQEDALLIDDWLEDLVNVGYIFPTRKHSGWHAQELEAKKQWLRPVFD